MEKARDPKDRPRREEAPAMDEERQVGAKRPDTLRPGPVEGRTREGERGPGEEKDDRSIATEEDDEELELDDDDEDLEDEDLDDDADDAEDEGRPARPVK
jgi:hypothetical protein